jgi:hypothetical protein
MPLHACPRQSMKPLPCCDELVAAPEEVVVHSTSQRCSNERSDVQGPLRDSHSFARPMCILELHTCKQTEQLPSSKRYNLATCKVGIDANQISVVLQSLVTKHICSRIGNVAAHRAASFRVLTYNVTVCVNMYIYYMHPARFRYPGTSSSQFGWCLDS